MCRGKISKTNLYLIFKPKKNQLKNVKFVFSSKKTDAKIEEGQAVGWCCWMNNFQKCKRYEKENT